MNIAIALKVLLYSHAFDPSLGGVETVSRTLAEGFVQRGIDCKVVTQSPGPGQAFAFEVVRQPGRAQVKALVQWADVVLFNGATVSLQPWVLLSRKPFVWVHVGYQAATLDGAGWVEGRTAPLTPWASVRFHAGLYGWPAALKGGLKLLGRRLVARHAVAHNIAITQWMDRHLPLPRQVQIYNPFPVDAFRAVPATPAPDHDFFFLGRLVQEKGIDTLIEAFIRLRRTHAGTPRLLLIGDGPERDKLQRMVAQAGLSDAVNFAGKQSGPALLQWVARGRIGVLPSVWFEPMGGVAVELMAAGRCLIVSAQGGLAECVGEAGLTFPNGDAPALAARMAQLLDDPALQQALVARGRERAQAFAPGPFIDRYVALLRGLVARGAGR